MAKYKDGLHVPDNSPVEVPLDMEPESQDEKIARAVSLALSKNAEKLGKETLEDAMDFDIEDEENDPISQHEKMADMQEEYLDFDELGQQIEAHHEQQETEETTSKAEPVERDTQITTDQGASTADSPTE
jgi:hypothetical protein